jgi:DNA-binding NtrC family response regulator
LILSAQMTLRLPRLSSILMTSYGGGALWNQAIDEHLFAYFDKPFNNDIMIATIEAGLAAWEAGVDPAGAARPQTLFPGRVRTKT